MRSVGACSANERLQGLVLVDPVHDHLDADRHHEQPEDAADRVDARLAERTIGTTPIGLTTGKSAPNDSPIALAIGRA